MPVKGLFLQLRVLNSHSEKYFAACEMEANTKTFLLHSHPPIPLSLPPSFTHSSPTLLPLLPSHLIYFSSFLPCISFLTTLLPPILSPLSLSSFLADPFSSLFLAFFLPPSIPSFYSFFSLPSFHFLLHFLPLSFTGSVLPSPDVENATRSSKTSLPVLIGSPCGLFNHLSRTDFFICDSKGTVKVYPGLSLFPLS